MSGNIIPVVVDRSLLQKVSNFPEEVYNFDPTDNLYYLMHTLLGDAGTGQLSLVQTTAGSTQDMRGIEFSDLDNIVGSLLKTSRLQNEQYGLDVNPYLDQLSINDWDNIHFSDSSYRERLALSLTAINNGGTVLGLTLLAEAILKCKVRILEQWKYSTLSNYWSTTSPTEFSVVALSDGDLTQQQIASVANMIKFLRPANSIVNVRSMSDVYDTAVGVQQIVADSEWFEFDKVVSSGNIKPTNKNNAVNFPSQYWLNPAQSTSAPLFSHRSSTEESIDLYSNIANIHAFIYGQNTKNIIGSPGSQRNTSGGVSYGDFMNLEKADSPDNYPNGKYPSDPGHYDTLTTSYNGASSAILSSLSTLTLTTTTGLVVPLSGSTKSGSISVTTGANISFTYTGITGSTLTGCVFDGDQSLSVAVGASVTLIISYNWEWASQAAYKAYMVKMVNKLGGIFTPIGGDQYQLPMTINYEAKNPVSVQQIASPAPFQIVGTAYGAL